MSGPFACARTIVSCPKNRSSRSACALVEGDEVGEGLHRRVGAEGREVGVEVGLELVGEDDGLGVAERVLGREVHVVHEDRAAVAQHGEGGVEERVHRAVVAGVALPGDAEAQAAEAVGVEGAG